MSSPEADEKSSIGCIFLGAPILVVILIISFVALLGGNADACADDGSASGDDDSVTVDPDQVPEGPIANYSGEQLVNAAHIIVAGKDQDLGKRDQTIGVMTAIGESTLINVDHGDNAGPDSRGLFQQRASWGSEEDRMDPYESATFFFEALKEVDGREDLDPTEVAHRVQANADPNHYAKHWDDARTIVDELADVEAGTNASGRHLPQTAAIAAPFTATATGDREYELPRVKDHVDEIAQVLGNKYGFKTIGGFREGNSRDPHGHPSGLALDFMTNDISDGSSVGDELADELTQKPGEYSVKYIIWEQRIWKADSPDDGWSQMEDRGDETQNHFDHVHVSFEADGEASEEDGSTNPECDSGGGQGDVNEDGWASPGEGPVTSPYGYRDHPVSGGRRLHAGTDLAAGGCGGEIFSANDGTVIAKGFDSGGNGYIKIDHGGGLATQYLHMYEDGMLANVGDTVNAGDQIAETGSSGGSTGCHLHYEVLEDGGKVDPEPFMEERGITLGE